MCILFLYWYSWNLENLKTKLLSTDEFNCNLKSKIKLLGKLKFQHCVIKYKT